MVYQLVVLVNLENESVVYVEAAENLHCEACSKQHKADHCGEDIGIHAGIDLIPVSTLRCRTYRKEEKEC